MHNRNRQKKNKKNSNANWRWWRWQQLRILIKVWERPSRLPFFFLLISLFHFFPIHSFRNNFSSNHITFYDCVKEATTKTKTNNDDTRKKTTNERIVHFWKFQHLEFCSKWNLNINFYCFLWHACVFCFILSLSLSLATYSLLFLIFYLKQKFEPTLWVAPNWIQFK